MLEKFDKRSRAGVLCGGVRAIELPIRRYIFSPEFAKVLWRMFVYIAISVPVSMALGLAVALLLNRPIFGRGLF